MVEDSRLVGINREWVSKTTSTDFPFNSGASGATSSSQQWSLEALQAHLQTKVTRLSSDRIELDLVGVDASVANAIRRVLLAEVPTVAIENVYVWNNTSIVVDEVFAHRLGLVPLKIDPKRMHFKGDDSPTDRNTMVFALNVSCERTPGTKEGDPNHIKGDKVLSGDLEWDPKGDQSVDWKDDPPRPVHQDILLAKLRPGQKVFMELHCVKGVGKDHTKFSPVSTASYRLLPHIDILDSDKIVDGGEENVGKFVRCFPQGVIGVRRQKETGREEIYVKDARKDTVSREVLRHPEFEDCVKLGRVRDHFMFDIESTGIIPPEELLPSAIEVLIDKIRTVKQGVEELERTHSFAAAPR
ncbi:RBP11-like subunits of RNA polymerase [Acaromyces ingoldii]|uniref:DNA-directed RNA polymerases I and III subunit RPAC1 n=1 Tax=Acaromyces ingoldii TaxID=215250 RepID=A0A316YD42_9BASI|nr:RBP11-like subunits of RNA polymerase [Acaromyces ingoldii]PWN87132.1 RBP11-like subunits of RNA polymerase [Acaromyces ingoldii]